MPINDSRTLQLKVNQLNDIFKDVQAYKQAHPEEKCGYYTQNYGSLLNAYREGDISFDECIELLKAIAPAQGTAT
jgi:hypothetical protein